MTLLLFLLLAIKVLELLVSDFVNDEEIFLEKEIASLDEVVIFAETRPKTGNDVVLRAIEELF